VSSMVSQTEAQTSRFQAARPSFFGIVGGELFKIRRMRMLWVSFFLLLAVLCLPNIIFFTLNNVQSLAGNVAAVKTTVTTELAIVRIFIGFFLLVLTANVYGREYQLGTVRILLARGVGRVQLLLAKLLAVVIMALIVLLFCLVLEGIWLTVLMALKVGSFDAFGKLDGAAWSDIGFYLLTVLVSMGMTILVSLTMTSLGRSLAFGLSASLAWFPADNILPVLLQLGYLLTKNDFWINVTQYFLGPILNYMPAALSKGSSVIGTAPAAIQTIQGATFVGSADLSTGHVWLVTGVYAVVFLAVSIYLTAVRDVRE
jgi:ABC-2 type transport system permease protein